MSTTEARFLSNRGAFCHMQEQGQIPVCAVTSLKHDEILFTNIGFDEDNLPTWALTSATIYLQRFWSSSTATLYLAPPSDDIHIPLPEAPIYKKMISGQEREVQLQPEDEICIYLGYLPVLRPVTAQDIEDNRLLRVYVGVIDTIAGIGTPKGISYTIQCRDRVRFLQDTEVTFDPSFGKTDAAEALVKAFGESDDALLRSALIARVSQLGVGYVERPSDAEGGEGFDNLNGLAITKGFVQDIGSFVNDAQAEGESLKGKLHPPDFFYICPNEHSEGVIPCKGRTDNAVLDIDKEIKFHIITGRMPYTVDSITKDFTIETQIPIEFIRFLGMQEPFPTEVFQNHFDGHLYYSPRVNDASGLNDPSRYYRTYYFRSIPRDVGENAADISPTLEGLSEGTGDNSSEEFITEQGCQLISSFDYGDIFSGVDYHQMAINFKEEMSSLGLKTNFIVANQAPGGAIASETVVLHMSARPSFLRGREIGGRNYYVIDETIKSPGEAAAVAASIARLHSKELNPASMTILGDPSIVPGEVVQVIGSPLYPQSMDLQTVINEREAYLEFDKRTRASYLSILDVTRIGISNAEGRTKPIAGMYENKPANTTGEVEIPDVNKRLVAQSAEYTENVNSLFTSVAKESSSTVVRAADDQANFQDSFEGLDSDDPTHRRSGFAQEPRTIWRVEGVRHNFNAGSQPGLTTELALLSAFN